MHEVKGRKKDETTAKEEKNLDSSQTLHSLQSSWIVTFLTETTVE